MMSNRKFYFAFAIILCGSHRAEALPNMPGDCVAGERSVGGPHLGGGGRLEIEGSLEDQECQVIMGGFPLGVGPDIELNPATDYQWSVSCPMDIKGIALITTGTDIWSSNQQNIGPMGNCEDGVTGIGHNKIFASDEVVGVFRADVPGVYDIDVNVVFENNVNRSRYAYSDYILTVLGSPVEAEEPTASPVEAEEPTASPIEETDEPTTSPVEAEEPTASPIEETDEPTASPVGAEELTAAPVLTSDIEDGAGGLEAGAIAGIAVGAGVVLLLPILMFAYRRPHRSDGSTSIQSHVPRDPPAHYGIPTHEDNVGPGQNSDNREPTGQLENREPAAAPLVAARVIYDDSGPLADVNLPDFKDQVRRSTNPTPVAKAKVQDSDSKSV